MMGMRRRMMSPGTDRGHRGAGVIEYSALVCVSAVLLAALMVPLRGRIAPWVHWGVCEVFTGPTGGKCEKPAEAKRKKKHRNTPCVVDSRTVSGGPSWNIEMHKGAVKAGLGEQKRSDGSLIVTLTLRGKVGLVLGAKADGNGITEGADVTGVLSFGLTFKNKKQFSKFKKNMQNKEVDLVSKYVPGPRWLVEKAVKYGNKLAPGVLIKVMYDAVRATIKKMNIPSTFQYSYGLEGESSASAGSASLDLDGSVATAKGENSNGTTFRSYTATLSAATHLNFVPDDMGDVSLDEGPSGDISGALTVQVNFDKHGKAKNAQATLRLQSDVGFKVDVGGHVEISKEVGAGGGVGIEVKVGEVLVISKNLKLTRSEKQILTNHKSDVEPTRASHFLTQIVEAIKKNIRGKYSVRLYRNEGAKANAHGDVDVLSISVAQGSADVNYSHQHLEKSWSYDPDTGVKTDEQCEKAA